MKRKISSPILQEKRVKSVVESIISWNVNGINAFVGKGTLLQDLVKERNPMAICLQETKLSQSDDKYGKLLSPGYMSVFHNSTAKKGYSGTAVYIRDDWKDSIIATVCKDLCDEKEGRIIEIEFENFYLINTYVPNSGDDLKRLGFRTGEWESKMRKYLFEKTKPIIWAGDLNCAILDIDTYDPKKLKKNAGFTDEERAEFRKYFDHGLIDTFRHFHPDEKDCYTYYGYRFKMKEKNKGWRLDYFLTSPSFKDSLVESNILKHLEGSDHIPIELKIKL